MLLEPPLRNTEEVGILMVLLRLDVILSAPARGRGGVLGDIDAIYANLLIIMTLLRFVSYVLVTVVCETI